MRNKVLAIITNHSRYPTKEEGAGLWLSELTHFYEIITEEGFEIDFASPEGREVPLDQKSLGWLFMDNSTKGYYNNPDFMKRLSNTLSANEVNWDDYSAVFFTGGHGTMWDFPDNEKLQEVSRKIYENGGVVSAVCHGNVGLINIKLSSGEYLVSGREMTGFSNFEETLVQMKKEVPFTLEDARKKRGANYRKAKLPFTCKVVVDGRLVTGQNPQSTKAVAKRVLGLLKQQQSEDR